MKAVLSGRMARADPKTILKVQEKRNPPRARRVVFRRDPE